VSCGGLHCAGCIGGMAVPVVPAFEFYGIVWVVEHLVEVVATSAVCGALAVAVVVFLMKRQERREVMRAATQSLWNVRAEALPHPERRAVGPAVVHFNFYGVPEREQAAVIRRAIDGGN
jgi:hypothetical protein